MLCCGLVLVDFTQFLQGYVIGTWTIMYQWNNIEECEWMTHLNPLITFNSLGNVAVIILNSFYGWNFEHFLRINHKPENFIDDENIGTGDGLVPSGNTPPPDPLFKVHIAIWHH